MLGLAQGAVAITSEATVTSITPSSGSIHGGQMITIAGTGFLAGDTTVDVDGDVCEVCSEKSHVYLLVV